MGLTQPGGTEMPTTPEAKALTVDDAKLLKLIVFLLFKKPIGRPKQKPMERLLSEEVLNEIGEIVTPEEPTDVTFEKLSRLEFNGGPLLTVHKTPAHDSGVLEISWLIEDSQIPGGTAAFAAAVGCRLYELVGMPWKLEEDEEDTKGEITFEQVKRLASSFAIRAAEPSVH